MDESPNISSERSQRHKCIILYDSICTKLKVKIKQSIVLIVRVVVGLRKKMILERRDEGV